MSAIKIGSLWKNGAKGRIMWRVCKVHGPDVYLEPIVSQTLIDSFRVSGFKLPRRLQIEDLYRTMRPVTKLEQLLKGVESES